MHERVASGTRAKRSDFPGRSLDALWAAVAGLPALALARFVLSLLQRR
jgi:hypothetical protein